jgi:WD40 repeat protein
MIITYNGSPDISVWNADNREETVAFKAAPQHVHDMQLAPSGDTIATVGDDNVVKFWDTATWKQRGTKLGYMHDGAKIIKFSPDGKYLVTLSDDGWLKCWYAPDFAADHSATVVRTEGEPTGIWTVYYSDGTVKQQFQNWSVRETRPDGTVKIYMQQ